MFGSKKMLMRKGKTMLKKKFLYLINLLKKNMKENQIWLKLVINLYDYVWSS